jgi:hypothetical protein
MFTESIRQYEFPEHDNGPEYRARERTYYTWRRNLERRYPQVCVECEVKVEEQLQKASYTAKSDHVRRMLDRTRARRQEVKKRGVLDIVDTAGRVAWHIAFLLQLLWHITVLSSLFMAYATELEVTFQGLTVVKSALRFFFSLLPPADQLIRWAITMSLVACPWNPRFKQTIRGFTAHILGFRQWYTYQLIAVLIRSVCLFIAQYNETNETPPLAQLGAHLGIVLLMSHLYNTAKRSIHTDAAPLFGSYKPPRAAIIAPEPAADEQSQGLDNLGDILDDILREPAVNSLALPAPSSSPLGHGHGKVVAHGHHGAAPAYQQGRNADLQAPLTNQPALQHYQQHEIPKERDPAPSYGRQTTLGLGSLGLSDRPAVLPPQDAPAPATTYTDEMDWSPSGSQHRAFANHNPYKIRNPNPRFSDAPIEAKPGPFWYKVPPAPINPARQLRNPPLKPLIRESPKDKKELFFSGNNGGPVEMPMVRGNDSGLVFKDPKFYAPRPADDPRDKLSRLMGSFSISPSPDEDASQTSSRPSTKQKDGKVRMAELIAVFGALYLWVIALGSEEAYASTLNLACACTCLIISIRLTADLLMDAQRQQGRSASLLGTSLATVGLGQVLGALILLARIWSTNASSSVDYGVHGYALFGVMIVHQVLHIF